MQVFNAVPARLLGLFKKSSHFPCISPWKMNRWRVVTGIHSGRLREEIGNLSIQSERIRNEESGASIAPDQNFSLPHGHNVLCLVEWRHIERLGAVPEYHHGAHVGDFVSAEGEQHHQRAFKLLHGADGD